MTNTLIHFPLPEWVQLIPICDVDTAEQTMVNIIANSQDHGQARLAEYESAASDVIDGAIEHGIWVLGLATPPGRPAALLSVTGFQVPITLDRHTTTDLLSYLEAHGGPGIAGLRFAPLSYGQTALILHRTDSSGSQAQAFVPDADGQGCFLFTLAAQQPDRGAELLELVREIVTTAMP
ncbi:MAG TPA: hypothetical protein VGX25_06360 [Actinophytocola sp.]|uniref:hypothetical protein n=1 Tax=Actinophytocola sp. TaxID=1872138 RepID=UPI002DDC9F8F|nr:hypothetical protein [Actinophytocola sp.]HEV2779009.1 hypothetical protein [Actinophytocola sp.]